MRKLFLILVVVIQIAYYFFWYSCQRLVDLYYFSFFNLKLHIDDTARYDSYQLHILAKFFNNKVAGFFVDLYSIVLHYFDIAFFVQLFSCIGCIGIALGIYYLWKKSKKAVLVLIGSSVLVSLGSAFLGQLAFVAFIIAFMIGGLVLSVFGIKKSLDAHPRLMPLFVLIFLLSVWWYFVFGMDVHRFCIIR